MTKIIDVSNANVSSEGRNLPSWMNIDKGIGTGNVGDGHRAGNAMDCTFADSMADMKEWACHTAGL